MADFNTKKRYGIIGLLVFLICTLITINAIVDKTKAWHSADDVLISIDNFAMTLQETIGNGFLIECAQGPSQPYTLQLSEPNHNTDRIWISIDGSEMSLQEAILTTSLCGSSPNPYINSINPGHLASEIEISIDGFEMSFQDAIDTGEFCPTSHVSYSCYDNDEYWYNLCDEREDKKQECSTDRYVGNNYCYGGDVYRDYITGSCSGNNCIESTSRIKQQDCGVQECSNGVCIRQCNWVNSRTCNSVATSYKNWFSGGANACADWCRSYSSNKICCSFSAFSTGFKQCSVHSSLSTKAATSYYNYCIIPAA